MASHEGSRKRLKVSRTEGTPTRTTMTPPASSSTSATEMAAKNSTSLVAPNHHEQTLKALNTDIDAMRQLVTCKICDRLLYEPYSLSCGHTYCYSCLSQWLVSNRKKTCPDCRAVITQQPTPSYIVRELVLIFIGRSELLPDGETSEEHHTLAREEAKIVAEDKANTDPTTGGLFKGCFSRRRTRIMPIHDPGDGVDRCPECHWELEDGVCEQCGFDVEEPLHDISDDDISDDSSDAVFGVDGQDDYFGEDDFEGDNSTIDDGDVAEETARRTMQQPLRRASPIDLRSSDGEESEDDEHDPTLRHFIVDDDQVDGATSDDGEDTDVPEVVGSRRLAGRRAHVVISDDEDETALSTAADQGSVAQDSDDDDDGPVVRGSQRGQRGHFAMRPRRELSVSEEEEEQSSDDGAGDHESSIAGNGGFSPLDESAGDAFSHRSECDSDHTSSIYPMYEEDGEDEEDSDGSEDGWGSLFSTRNDYGLTLTRSTATPAETPRGGRHPPPTNSHRLGSLGQRSNRHIEPQHNYSGFFQGQPTVRSARPNPGGFERYPIQRPGMYAQPPPFGILRPPVHPFQLGNTLAGINYNQRNQQMRFNPNQRTASAGSSRSSNGGGVGVHSSGSSGSSATIRADAGRRKRALSISSDVSYE